MGKHSWPVTEAEHDEKQSWDMLDEKLGEHLLVERSWIAEHHHRYLHAGHLMPNHTTCDATCYDDCAIDHGNAGKWFRFVWLYEGTDLETRIRIDWVNAEPHNSFNRWMAKAVVEAFSSF